jgi:hypothetical protein
MFMLAKAVFICVKTAKKQNSLFMNLTWKTGALLALVIAVGVLGGLQANQLVNRAKTVPPAPKQ